MKTLSVFVLLVLLGSCSDMPRNNIQTVQTYIEGLNTSDHQMVRSVLGDSFSIFEGDYVMKFTPETYYHHFQWDSVFQPEYRLVDITPQDSCVLATISVRSARFEYLKNNPLSCRHRFYFDSGKIGKMETLDCPDANWQLWQSQVDSLVAWVSKYHPELNGFIYDQTLKGAENYLEAIERYRMKPD